MIKFLKKNELISPEELEVFEGKLEGLHLPEDYKQHMLFIKGGNIMKLALPSRNNMIDDHFGHCDFFTVLTVNTDE